MTNQGCSGPKQHVRQVLHPGSLPPEGDTARIYPAILVAINATLIVVSVSALIGIWSGRAPG